MKVKNHKIMYKSYSNDIIGYHAIFDDLGHFIVLNSNLSHENVEKSCSELLSLSAKYPQEKFILLKSDGSIQTYDYFKSKEMSDAV